MKDFRTIIEILQKMNYILTRKQKLECIGIMGLIIVSSVFEMLGVSAILPFLQALTSTDSISDKWYFEILTEIVPNISTTMVITVLGLSVALIYIVKNVIIYFSYCRQVSFRMQTEKDLCVSMMNSFLGRPYTFFLETSSGEILQSTGADIHGVYSIIEFVFRIISEGLTCFLITIFLMTTDIVLSACVLVLGILCMILIIFVTRKQTKEAGIRNRDACTKQYKTSLQIIEGIKEIFVSYKADFFRKKYDYVYEQKKNADTIYNKLILLPDRIIETLCISGMMLMISFRIISGTDPSKIIPTLAAFAMGAFRILPSISKISNSFTGIIFNRPALYAAYDNIKAVRELDNVQGSQVNDSNASLEYSLKISIDDIKWKYNGGKGYVIDGLCMTINKGEAIGLVGESGAGKTTLVDIILGLLPPEQGNIKVDGVEITETPKSWADLIGYVPQTLFLMDESIRENIAFGIDIDKIDDGKVWKALDEAQIGDFVRALPDGIYSNIGERGVRISGGQRQRMVIARALYNNPEIIILDEATSALDNETELSVMEAINSLHGKKTLIIVAHRLSTIMECDKIYEIKAGKASEVDKMKYIDNKKV